MDRTEAIEMAINIENWMSILITHHFFPREGVYLDFLTKVLHDEGFSANLRRSIFIKCYPDTPAKIDNAMRRLFAIRNIFAHSGLYLGTLETEQASDIVEGLQSAKKLGKVDDLNALLEEAKSLNHEILKFLEEKVEKTGIKQV